MNVLLAPGMSLMPVTLSTTPVTSPLSGTMSLMSGFFASAPRICSGTVSPSRERLRAGVEHAFAGVEDAARADGDQAGAAAAATCWWRTSRRRRRARRRVPSLPDDLGGDLPPAPSVSTARFGTVWLGSKLRMLEVPAAEPRRVHLQEALGLRADHREAEHHGEHLAGGGRHAPLAEHVDVDGATVDAGLQRLTRALDAGRTGVEDARAAAADGTRHRHPGPRRRSPRGCCRRWWVRRRR